VQVALAQTAQVEQRAIRLLSELIFTDMAAVLDIKVLLAQVLKQKNQVVVVVELVEQEISV
jgi:hypothetical protein